MINFGQQRLLWGVMKQATGRHALCATIQAMNNENVSVTLIFLSPLSSGKIQFKFVLICKIHFCVRLSMTSSLSCLFRFKDKTFFVAILKDKDNFSG